MKKALSLVLAIVMVLSLGVSAVASDARNTWVATGETITVVETSATFDATNATATPVTPGRQANAPAAGAILVSAFTVAPGVQARVIMPVIAPFATISADSAVTTATIDREAIVQINVSNAATPATGFEFSGDIDVPATITHTSLANITATPVTVAAMPFDDFVPATVDDDETAWPNGNLNIVRRASATAAWTNATRTVAWAPGENVSNTGWTIPAWLQNRGVELVGVAQPGANNTLVFTFRAEHNATLMNHELFNMTNGTHTVRNVQLVTAPAVVAGQIGQVPNGWRIDGVSDLGDLSGRIDLLLVEGEMTGDAARFIPVMPSDFTWRVPNPSGSGFTTFSNWRDIPDSHRPVGMSENAFFAMENNSAALRTQHFDRVTLRSTRTTGMNGTIRDVGFHYSNGRRLGDGTVADMAIRIRTVEFMTRTGDNHVEFDLNLAVTGSANRPLGRVAINVRNNELFVYDNQEFIDPTTTDFITADDTIRNLEIYAGAGVYFTRNITSGQSLYIAADLATHDGFESLFQQHAELVDIIEVHASTGWTTAQVRTRIDRGDVLFVYDAERRLIGTTADRNLPFSTVYFLTNAQVNLGGTGDGGTDAPVEDNNDSDFDGVPGTGGDVAPPNANFNPGTGR